MIELTALCALACAALLLAEHRHHTRARVIAKVVASLAFLGVGVVASTTEIGFAPWWWFHPYREWMLAGLVLGVAGDIALLGTGKRAFQAGLAAFLLGHLAYIAAFARTIDPREWWRLADGIALAPIAVATSALALLWRRLGGMRVPVILYLVAICTMTIGALAFDRVGMFDNHRIAIGAVLFFVSDLAVARDKFVGSTFTNKAWGLPAYYAGQLALAWSLAG